MHRRQLLAGAGLAGIGLCPLSTVDPPAPDLFPRDGAEALKLIEPGLTDLDLKQAAPARLAAAVEANVRWSVRQLADLHGAGPALKAGRIKLVGAVYELDSGKVRLLD